MKLKQFLVRCPYVPHEEKLQNIMNEYEVSYSEAKKIDYRDNHKEKVVMMRDYTRCITSMIERYFIPINTDKYWEILINVVKEEDKDFRENSNGGALETYCVYNYDDFFNLNDEEIKKVTLNLVENTVLIAMIENDWDTTSFKNACEQVRLHNYKNEWVWKTKRKNNYIAEVLIEHNVKYAKIFLVVKDDNGKLISEKLIAKTLPNEFVFEQYLGNIKWIKDNCVVLTSKKGETFDITI